MELDIFKGIPYAKAKRFQALRKWNVGRGLEKLLLMDLYVRCLNRMFREENYLFLIVTGRWMKIVNLNIWTRKTGTKGEKTSACVASWWRVLAGSSIEQNSDDGFNLCKKGDVVVVSVNHRLNILGYFDMSPFGEKYKNSANAGHADIVAALKWVHQNIEGFGGDSENVTVFGHLEVE